MIYIYDIECFPNFFCVTFKEVNTGEVLYFEISEWKKDISKLYNFIHDDKKWFIGYNNHYYDNQLLNYICDHIYRINSNIINEQLYELSQDIINNDLRDYKYNLPFNSLDLMRVGNTYQKSLKLLGCNLQHPKLQDLPLPYNYYVKQEDVELIKLYNLNDVEITEKLYNVLLPQIKLRKEITQMYGVNVMDESDSGIANKLLEKEYSELTGLPFSEFKDLRTHRDYIHFSDVIFKNIKFETPELKSFLDKLRSFVLIKDKTYFKKSIIFRGLKLNLGVGGIHSDDRPGLFRRHNEEDIIDLDISSMYPSLIINHRLCPEHLDSRFLIRYIQLRDDRLNAKHNGITTKADALKIVLNSTYGKMNFEHHWLYDPLQAYKVTVNGQLYIMMLIEKLTLAGFKILSCNTDGITAIVPHSVHNLYKNICRNWEIETSFELEYVDYQTYCRRDINNYIAHTSYGKLKNKGDFVIDTPLQKGVDKKIIAIALQEYFINNKSIKDTITNHTNIYDFCTAMRTDPKFTTEFHYLKDNELVKQTMQKTNRYYISKRGGKLYKWKYAEARKAGMSYDCSQFLEERKPNEVKQYFDYCVNRQVTIFNDYIDKPMSEYDIDYGYYISETQKIIDLIIPPQLTLF